MKNLAVVGVIIGQVVILVTLFLIGYGHGYKEGYAAGAASGPGDAETLIGYMEEARYTHQYYVEHTDRLQPGFGDVDFHQVWVDRYDAVIDYIEGRDNDNGNK